VYISGLLWTGIPHELLQAAETEDIVLMTTSAILEEVQEALVRPKFAKRIMSLNTSVGELMESLLSIVEVMQEPKVEPVIVEDPDDDKFLACAIASRARWIISGDSHLLTLKRYRNVHIVTPRQFWDAQGRRFR
ncbi:MAG: putative toxin-antitoxin system toxin component, PIN family, partial [Candidatus Binatia bacterium]